MKKYLILIIAAMFLLTGCSNLYESNKDGYTTATSVHGVTFDIPTLFLQKATAITSIADDTDYSKNTYLYKDGKSTYFLFNVNDVVVAVQKDTTFALRTSKDIANDITKSSVCNIWINNDEKIHFDKQDKNGVFKLIADVNADVSITPTLYLTCIGKFATIQYKDYEYSIFAGIPFNEKGNMTNDQKNTINHIVKSLTIDKDYVGFKDEAETESLKDTSAETQVETETTHTEVPKTESEETNKNTQEEQKETEVESERDTENKNTETVTEDKKDDKETEIESETESSTEPLGIYNPLSLGVTGKLLTIGNDGLTTVTTHITLKKLYTGEDAEKIIKKYCDTDECPYEYMDAPVGSSWHVMEYTLETNPYELYVNIKLKGLDGEKLKFRGASYSSRTFDIFAFMKESEDGYKKLYCYYAVPNGCKEYLLECGYSLMDVNDAAYYKIKVD